MNFKIIFAILATSIVGSTAGASFNELNTLQQFASEKTSAASEFLGTGYRCDLRAKDGKEAFFFYAVTSGDSQTARLILDQVGLEKNTELFDAVGEVQYGFAGPIFESKENEFLLSTNNISGSGKYSDLEIVGHCAYTERLTRIHTFAATNYTCMAQWTGYMFNSDTGRCEEHSASGCSNPFAYKTFKSCQVASPLDI